MNNYKILLVEDDVDLGNVLKQYLELEGYEVNQCYNGDEGLVQFTNGDFDLCILDVMMPKMDGFTLAKSIKTLDPKIPFISFSEAAFIAALISS